MFLFYVSDNLSKFLLKTCVVTVRVPTKRDRRRPALSWLYERPDPLMREKEDKTKRCDQTKSAKIPGDERAVKWVVFYRKHVRERRFFVILQAPFISGFRGAEHRSVLRRCIAHCKDS